MAATPNASTTCTGGTLTASAGAGSIAYTGGTVAAGATCTVQADVTGATAGDAITAHALDIQRWLRALGIHSEVYALHLLLGKIASPGNSPFSLTGQPSAGGTAREENADAAEQMIGEAGFGDGLGGGRGEPPHYTCRGVAARQLLSRRRTDPHRQAPPAQGLQS